MASSASKVAGLDAVLRCGTHKPPCRQDGRSMIRYKKEYLHGLPGTLATYPRF